MASVLVVCLGNICRSPMAEGILRALARERGRDDLIIDSAGTAGHHADEEADPRTRAVLARHGASFPHAARRVLPDDFHRFDLILAMDAENLADLRARCPSERVGRLRAVLEPIGGGDVPDPWYEGPEAFQRTWELLLPALRAWIDGPELARRR
ncbi:MAG TPA: low molecular weight protein-tyrosine-phosphatase [Myxococcota bacterium]|nr:low molecular weight protein-tyrosine-phosphatase [Myxococcota bacterium]